MKHLALLLCIIAYVNGKSAVVFLHGLGHRTQKQACKAVVPSLMGHLRDNTLTYVYVTHISKNLIYSLMDLKRWFEEEKELK